VKTGTTTDWRDNWTIGYSTKRIVGVWVGNADNTPMLDVSGIDGAGPIWHDVMLAAHRPAPPPFIRPKDIQEIAICAPSGMLPSPNCQRVRNERYIPGTEPTKVDDQFVSVPVDRATGLAATITTPANRRADRIYWMLPPEYHDWMVSQGIAFPPSAQNTPAEMASALPRATGPLFLAAPTSNTAYEIYPGVPRDRQRIEVSGFVIDGSAWAELRLMVDGQAIAEVHDGVRIQSWWQFKPGTHHFWL
jgi:membrane carboxypeptidase/penicillin-binding protein PbpC